jgi:quercetin dioxygenase-like cupin family protein
VTLSIKNIDDLARNAHRSGIPVHGAPALGVPLHTNGHLGADLLYVAAGDRFPIHTHPGDHLLLCVAGAGTITIGQVTYKVTPGDIYMVDGQVPHAVGAAGDQPHVLVAIGAPHKPVQSPERMALVDWDGNKVARPLFADGG